MRPPTGQLDSVEILVICTKDGDVILEEITN